jgi:putative PIN family toxin of toxin-antitoxin system
VRLVLDTNVVISALLWGGTPERLIELAGDGSVELITSQALLDELSELLGRPKLAAKLAREGQSAAEIIARYAQAAEVVDASPVVESRVRDPDDAAVLGCAIAARAEAIVSGDKDLLSLGVYQEIPILSPARCLERLSTPPAS